MLPIILWLLLGSPLVASNVQQVALAVSPHFARPGQKVIASMFIPDVPVPREACLFWTSENEEGKKCWEHNNEGDFPTGHFSYPIIVHYPGVFQFQLQVLADKLYVTPTQEVEVQ